MHRQVHIYISPLQEIAKLLSLCFEVKYKSSGWWAIIHRLIHTRHLRMVPGWQSLRIWGTVPVQETQDSTSVLWFNDQLSARIFRNQRNWKSSLGLCLWECQGSYTQDSTTIRTSPRICLSLDTELQVSKDSLAMENNFSQEWAPELASQHQVAGPVIYRQH